MQKGRSEGGAPFFLCYLIGATEPSLAQSPPDDAGNLEDHSCRQQTKNDRCKYGNHGNLLRDC